MTYHKIILYFFIFLTGFFGVSFWSAWLVTHPARIKNELTPENYKLPFENVKLTTKDNILIDGWFIPAPVPQKPALVILHGYPAEKGDLLFRARELHPDFNIFLIDFRYFGESGGTHTTLGSKERFDVEAALDFLESRGFEKAGVFGFSLGGAAAILQAAQDDRIAAVASYASFADVTLLGKDVYSHLPIIRDALVPLMNFWAKTFWGVDATYSPQDAAQYIQIPILIIHSRQDDQIPFHHALLLRDALRDNKQAEFYFIESGLHGELPLDFGEKVRNFFLQHVSS